MAVSNDPSLSAELNYLDGDMIYMCIWSNEVNDIGCPDEETADDCNAMDKAEYEVKIDKNHKLKGDLEYDKDNGIWCVGELELTIGIGEAEVKLKLQDEDRGKYERKGTKITIS